MTAPLTGGSLHAVAGAASYVESVPEYASNTGVIIGDEAILVVDSRLTPDLGRNLRSVVAPKDGPERRVVLVNTHMHGDHWFGNVAFKDAPIISSQWTQQHLHDNWTEQVKIFTGNRPHQADEFATVEPVLPNLGISSAVTVGLGQAQATVLPLSHAHTPGDVIVLAERGTVAYAGDVITNRHWPVLWDANLPGWMSVLDQLAGMGLDVIVPGHGPVGEATVIGQMQRALGFLCHLALLPADRWEDAADRSEFRDWLHRKRFQPGVETITGQLDPDQIAQYATLATA